MTEWGPAIPVDGKRPEWLRDGSICGVCHGGSWWGRIDPDVAENWDWDKTTSIKLPAVHFAYTALAKGFEPWGGGDEVPADWDGGRVLDRVGNYVSGGGWKYINSIFKIIGYRKKGQTMTAANDIPAELVERMVNVIRAHVSSGNAPVNGKSQWAEFQDIAAALLKPVDPEKEAVRQIARKAAWAKISAEQSDDSGYWGIIDTTAGFALACFRAGREYERDNR